MLEFLWKIFNSSEIREFSRRYVTPIHKVLEGSKNIIGISSGSFLLDFFSKTSSRNFIRQCLRIFFGNSFKHFFKRCIFLQRFGECFKKNLRFFSSDFNIFFQEIFQIFLFSWLINYSICLSVLSGFY